MRDVEGIITIQWYFVTWRLTCRLTVIYTGQIKRRGTCWPYTFTPELRDIKTNASRQLSSDITLSMKQRVHEQLPLMTECPMSNSKAIQPRPTIWSLTNKGHHQRVRRLSPRLHPRPLSASMILLSTISWDHPSQRLDRTKLISRRSFRKGPAIEARLCADS